MSLHYELEVLDDLISDTMDPKNIFTNDPDRKRVREWIAFIGDEKERIRKGIRKSMSSIVPDDMKTIFIRQHQFDITRLLDATINYLMPKDVFDIKVSGSESPIEKLYKTAYLALDELLFYLRDNYPVHFDCSLKIPDAYKWKNSVEMERGYKMIKKYLQIIKVDSIFSELICEPFENFLYVENDFSYCEMNYLQALQKALLDILKLKTADYKEQVIEKLFYLNFNSVLFYNYYILRLKEEGSERKSVTDLVEFYSWQIKILNQRIVKPNCIYLCHLEPLRDQLIFWIAEDLHYLNKKHQLSLALPVSREVIRDKVKKVHVNLTVPDLALGARLLLDDVIINSNYTELMERVARNFRTNRRESLSNNNTYNEGFNISVVTKEKMKGLLLKLSRKVSEF